MSAIRVASALREKQPRDRPPNSPRGQPLPDNLGSAARSSAWPLWSESGRWGRVSDRGGGSSQPGSERRVGVEVALGQNAECRQTYRELGGVGMSEAIVRCGPAVACRPPPNCAKRTTRTRVDDPASLSTPASQPAPSRARGVVDEMPPRQRGRSASPVASRPSVAPPRLEEHCGGGGRDDCSVTDGAVRRRRRRARTTPAEPDVVGAGHARIPPPEANHVRKASSPS